MAARDTELERLNAKVDQFANNNAEYRDNIAKLEDARSELKNKVHETEILVQKLEREKTEMSAEIQVSLSHFTTKSTISTKHSALKIHLLLHNSKQTLSKQPYKILSLYFIHNPKRLLFKA